MKTLKDYKEDEIYRGNVYYPNIKVLKTYKVIDGYVNLNLSEIESFKDFKVEIVTGNFFCSYCNNLKSLQSSLKIVYGNFYCTYCNNLEDLEGLPIIKKYLYCWDLPKLNIQKSIAAIENSGIPFENICCEDNLKVYLQFEKNPNDFVKLRGFNLKLKVAKMKTLESYLKLILKRIGILNV